MQPEHDTPQSPDHRRNTTPRPSISPLSAKASPVMSKESTMQEVDVIGVHGNLDDDDSRSSSLSEPEDDIDEPIHANGAQPLIAATHRQSAHQTLEVDSEAETERLDQTPDKSRKQADSVAKTPSKLSNAAAADAELSEPSSPVPDVNFGTNAIDRYNPNDRELFGRAPANTETVAGKKRKRSDTADSSLSSAESDIGESPRKRSHNSVEDDTAIVVARAAPAEADYVPQTIFAPVENDDFAADAQDTVVVSSAKPGKGRKSGKQKGQATRDVVKDVEHEKPPEMEQPEEEQSEEAVAKAAEELKHKNTASAVFDDLAKQFTAFREKMYNERLTALNAELEVLNQPDCKHPEYLRQVACVDARYQRQANETQAFYKFKLESLRRTTLGERSQLHSQYFQHARDLREGVMYKLGEDWYNIQKERRQGNHGKDDAFVYKFQTKKNVQVKQQAKYNQEVSILSGVAKYVGFPAAPDIIGAEGNSLEDDLKAMKLSKRGPQAATIQQPVYIPNRSGLLQGQSERIAHEQFIEQTPWARPQGQFHNYGTPNLTHTPNWAAEPGAHSAKHIIRNLSGSVPRAGSPYTTPIPQRRTQLETSSSGTVPVNSDAAEQPSSVLAAPPTSDGLQHGQLARDQGSPLAVTKHRQNGELTGFRNISNVSGASTIDAPPNSAEKAQLPHILKEAVASSQHVFDTKHQPRSGGEQQRQHDMYASAHFRPQEGAYGTPAPLPAPSAGL